MFKNYLKIAVRNLLKNRIYSFINIIGLAIGLATCLLIMVYVLHETSYDQFHTNSDRIFRIVQTMGSEDRKDEQASSPFPLGPVLEAEFPDYIEASARFYNMQEPNHTFLNREDNISFREENFYFVDSTFFSIFSGELIQGNPDEALKNPLSLVISQPLAKKYFGDENPMGQTLSYKGIRPMTVTGVMKPWPKQSHFQIDLIASFSGLNEIYASSPNYDESWYWNPVWTYIKLKEGVNPERITSQFPDIAEKYYYTSPGWPDDESLELALQPITDIHLHSNLDQEMRVNSSQSYIYILLAVAAFILIIACINFMNLSTARSLERGREVGMRKVLGGYRKQLFYQFMGESLLMTFVAVIIGALLAIIALPYFNGLTGEELSLRVFHPAVISAALVILTLLVGVAAGLYPALFLSSFKPVEVLKGNTQNNRSAIVFRKSLVTFQFILSAMLLVGTAVIYLQIQHIQQKDLGFDKRHVVLLPTKQNLIAWEFEQFKQQALTHSQIETVAGIGKIPGSESQEYYRFTPVSAGASEDRMNLGLFVTHDFLKTFDIKLVAGRDFSRDFPADASQSVLINRSMLTQLKVNTPEEAIGKTINYYTDKGEREVYNVIGVVEDFNYTSLKKEIEPLVIRLVEDTRSILGSVKYTAVRIAPGSAKTTLAHLEKTWKDINHIDPFEYHFLDQRLDEVYQAEQSMSQLAASFSILCIIIACLGLLGLAAYSAQLRKQEIGIRKSLGASVTNIIFLLSKDFLVLVIIANIIAWPVSYFLGLQWLRNFPYRFELWPTLLIVFMGTALITIIITLATVGYHSVKSALINPVESIRNQ